MIDKHKQLVDFGKKLLDCDSVLDGLATISEYSKLIMHSERCSIFMYDKEASELWTTLSDGIEKIVIPFDVGLIGLTIRTKKPILENDPYGNSNFLADVDIHSGYYTQNLITAPIFNSMREIVGVIELLNKEGGFQKQDLEFLSFFSHYISAFIELTNMYERGQFE